VDGWRSASIGLSGVGRKEEVARIPGMRSAAAKLAFLPEQNRRMQAGGTRIGGHVLGSIGGRRSNARTFVGSARAGGTRDRSVYRSATRRHYLLADGGVTATCVHDDDDSVPLQRRSCHRQHPTAPRTRAPCFATSPPVMAGGDPSRRRCLDVLAGSLSLGETAARANIPQIVTPLSHSAAYFGYEHAHPAQLAVELRPGRCVFLCSSGVPILHDEAIVTRRVRTGVLPCGLTENACPPRRK
jgi:hypothetical protein